jgi:hypothetical protein
MSLHRTNYASIPTAQSSNKENAIINTSSNEHWNSKMRENQEIRKILNSKSASNHVFNFHSNVDKMIESPQKVNSNNINSKGIKSSEPQDDRSNQWFSIIINLKNRLFINWINFMINQVFQLMSKLLINLW